NGGGEGEGGSGGSQSLCPIVSGGPLPGLVPACAGHVALTYWKCRAFPPVWQALRQLSLVDQRMKSTASTRASTKPAPSFGFRWFRPATIARGAQSLTQAFQAKVRRF